MIILCILAWLPVTMALVYLAREAEITESWRLWLASKVYSEEIEKDRTSAVSRASRSSRFVLAMLSCAPCTSAWVAPWSAFGLWGLSGEPVDVRGAILCLVVAPLVAVGALWMVMILSPLEAFGFLSARSKEGKANGTGTEGSKAG